MSEFRRCDAASRRCDTASRSIRRGGSKRTGRWPAAAAGSREVEWHGRELGGPPSRKGQPDDFKHAWLDLDVNNNLQKGREKAGAGREERGGVVLTGVVCYVAGEISSALCEMSCVRVSRVERVGSGGVLSLLSVV